MSISIEWRSGFLEHLATPYMRSAIRATTELHAERWVGFKQGPQESRLKELNPRIRYD